MHQAAELQELERFLHEQIPLTRAMQLRVVVDEAAGFAIEAPLAPNHNHLQTAFGGSIQTVALLAGYSFLWLNLRDQDAHAVVRESSTRFLRPIRETICAMCVAPSEETMREFQTKLSARGKARLQLVVHVMEAQSLAAEFTGEFVAMTETRAPRPS